MQAVVEHRLADVPERRVPQVVPEADRLREVLVQPQRARHVAGDPAGLERVGEARAVVVALGGDEHLGLVLEPAEGLGVDDPVAVALEGRAVAGVLLRAIAREPGRSARRAATAPGSSRRIVRSLKSDRRECARSGQPPADCLRKGGLPRRSSAATAAWAAATRAIGMRYGEQLT